METTGVPARISLTADRSVIQADNRDVAVCNIELQDKKKRFVPTACNDLTITVSGPVRILGWGMRPRLSGYGTFGRHRCPYLSGKGIQRTCTGAVAKYRRSGRSHTDGRFGKYAGNFLCLEVAEVSGLSFISSGEAETFLLSMGQERDLRFFLPQTIVCKCTRCTSRVV